MHASVPPGALADPDTVSALSARPGYDATAEATRRRVLPKLVAERVVWLSTVCPNGLPHLVPAWFWWDGEALLVFSKPNAVKVRNLERHPGLMIALGDPEDDFDVGLIEAEASCLDGIVVPEAFFAKYATELARAGLDHATFRRRYTRAIRIVPRRFLAWRGQGPRHEERITQPAGGILSPLPAWA